MLNRYTLKGRARVLNHYTLKGRARVLNHYTLKGRVRVLGEEHPDTLVNLNLLADHLRFFSQHEEAETVNRQALTARENILGKGHAIPCLVPIL
jgi:hypothetical protein